MAAHHAECCRPEQKAAIKPFGGWEMKIMWNLQKNVCSEKYVLIKKNFTFTNGQNMGVSYASDVYRLLQSDGTKEKMKELLL